jgi:hypothetical protein
VTRKLCSGSTIFTYNETKYQAGVSDTLKGVATLAYKPGLRVSEIANLNGVKLILNKEFLGLKLQKPKITSTEPSILILK